MPAQKGAINDKQIAAVMTYVRYKFGNISETVVTKEMVEVARQKFGNKANQYTASELSAEDVMLEGEQPEWLSPESEEVEVEAEGDSAAVSKKPNQFNS